MMLKSLLFLSPVISIRAFEELGKDSQHLFKEVHGSEVRPWAHSNHQSMTRKCPTIFTLLTFSESLVGTVNELTTFGSGRFSHFNAKCKSNIKGQLVIGKRRVTDLIVS
jgi:hypothetical protein